MKCVYHDAKNYEFHPDDVSDRCFLCSCNNRKLFIVRQIESMKMVHMCPECMIEYSREYLLDNTRPWEGNEGHST